MQPTYHVRFGLRLLGLILVVIVLPVGNFL